MAEPDIPKMKPDEKLLKQVDADNKKLKDAIDEQEKLRKSKKA